MDLTLGLGRRVYIAAESRLSRWTYSERSATNGSTRAARRAGIQHATAAATVSNNVAAARVGGSYVVTPTS